jgi:hypothetical protein
MTVSRLRRFYFFRRIRFTIADDPKLWIEIRPRLANKIRQALDVDWFGDALTPSRS